MDLPCERVNASQRSQILTNVGYTEKSLSDDIDRLRLWIKSQDHFPPSASQETEDFFETFLVGCKGNFETCKKKLDSYYSLRSRLPHLLCPMDPLDKDLISTKDKWLMAPLPKLTPDGCLVTCVSHPDYTMLHIPSCAKRLIMQSEIRSRQCGMLAGEWGVLDVSKVSPSMLTSLPLNVVRDFFYYIQKGLPVRLKGIVYFNIPSYLVGPINTLLKPLLPKKIVERIFFYPDEKGLLNHFPVDILPADYGGKAKSLKELSDDCLEICSSKRDLFLGPLMETTDEKRRLHKTDDDLLIGYFRQLEID